MTNLDERASGNNGRAPGHAAARTWVVLCALALLAYSVLRAVLVSFSWDESWTYLHHVLPGMFFQGSTTRWAETTTCSTCGA